MKHKLYILSVALMASAVSSDAFAYARTSRTHPRDVMELIYKPSVSYNKDVVESPGWKGNWFVGANGGINAFLGSLWDATISVAASRDSSASMPASGSLRL